MTASAESPPRGAPASPLSPVAGAERVELIDVLRGFALLGILLVNIEVFAAPIQLWFSETEWFPGPLDRAAGLFVRFFAQGKFYTLFSILFGLGLSIQFERLEARGVNPLRFVARRLRWLFVIGLVHAFLIWMGDILVAYALCGFLVLPFRKRRIRTLVVWAVLLLLVPLAIFAVPAFLVEDGRGGEEQLRAAIDTAVAAYSSGDMARIFRQRAQDVLLVWGFSLMSVPNFLGLFLVGLTLGRLRIFQGIETWLPLLRRWLWRLAALGVAGNAIMVAAMELSPDPTSPGAWLGQVGATFGVPALTLFYVSAIALLAQRASWRRRLAPIGALGRMALSNYLLQSLICTAIFNGYGWAGLYGQMSTFAGVVLAFAIYLMQIPLSTAWLGRFRFGPAEWLWRSLTYGRPQPMLASPRRS